MDKKSAPDISGSWSPPMEDGSLTAKSNPHNARDGESQPRSMVHKENDEYVPSSFGLPRESVDKFA